MNFKITTKFLLLFFLLAHGFLKAQDFKATVDKTTVEQNERFQVYFSFTDANINAAQNFKPPAFRGVHVISGPNQSTSMQIINGKMSGSLTYSYVVSIPEIGDLTIGSAQIVYEGKRYETEPIKVKIIKGSAKQQQKQNSSGFSNEDLAKNVFIRAIPNKQKVYKGEQITITYKLYTRLNIGSPQINKLPSYKGFWAEELETSNNIRFQVEMYNGERYNSAVIKRVALFPSKSGKLSVTPFELNIPVQVRKSRSRKNSVFDEFFNDSFFGRTETIDHRAKSNTVNVEVLPLPTANQPKSFNGAVGSFTFNSELNKTDIEMNESITLKFNIRGKGNIKLIDLPELDLPAGFEKYDPKKSESIDKRDVVGGNKLIEYLIVPRIPGEKEIPPVEFSFFDPSKKQYVTLASPTYNLSIKEGDKAYETSVSGYSKEDVKLLSQDIRFIQTSDFDFQKISERSALPGWFWSSIVIPFVAFVGIIGIKKRQDKVAGNVGLMKYQKAEKAAKNKLKVAKIALDASDNTQFYNELSNALFGYLEDKLGLQKADFSHDRVLDELKKREIGEGLVSRVKEIAEKCEFARFAPKDEGGTAAANLYGETVKVIVELESKISNKKKK